MISCRAKRRGDVPRGDYFNLSSSPATETPLLVNHCKHSAASNGVSRKRRGGDSNPLILPAGGPENPDCPTECPTLAQEIAHLSVALDRSDPASVAVVLIKCVSELRRIEAKSRKETHAR